MILDKLNSYVSQLPENQKPENHLRLSSSGDCQRSLEYDGLHGKGQISYAQYFRMELGHAVHLGMQKIIAAAFGDDFHDCESEVSLEGYPGHPDGRFKSLKATLEIKSVSDSTYQMVVKQGKPLDAHIDQGNAYAIAQGDEYVICLYVNRDTGEMTEFMFEASKDLAERVVAKFKRVEENRRLGIVSARPYNDASESPCWFCSHVKRCYEGYSDEVKKYTQQEIKDEIAISSARLFIKHRTQRLICEKAETVLKKSLSDFMTQNKLNVASMNDETGPIEVSMTVGKNNNLLVNIKEKK